jgi:hypothetical protein
MGWADNIILAMAPLGIVTAIVAAIRVGGPSWLRAVIGRARENLAVSEAELMSSTSKEVCEVWNGQEVVRCMGLAPVVEFICLLQYTDDAQSEPESRAGPSIEVLELKEAIDKHYIKDLGKMSALIFVFLQQTYFQTLITQRRSCRRTDFDKRADSRVSARSRACANIPTAQWFEGANRRRGTSKPETRFRSTASIVPRHRWITPGDDPESTKKASKNLHHPGQGWRLAKHPTQLPPTGQSMGTLGIRGLRYHSSARGPHILWTRHLSPSAEVPERRQANRRLRLPMYCGRYYRLSHRHASLQLRRGKQHRRKEIPGD